VPPAQAVAILRQAGLQGVLVSSSDDEGTQKLLAAAPDLVVPELRPYRRRADMNTWGRDDGVVRYLEERLARFRYVGIGEFHLYGADAELPVPRRMTGIPRPRPPAAVTRSTPATASKPRPQGSAWSSCRSRRRWSRGCLFRPISSSARRMGAALPVALQFDADMPAHRHGMNYRPTLRAPGEAATKTRHVHLQNRNVGEFKASFLRNVAQIAPYLHDGRRPTLAAAVRHDAKIDLDRLHADGEHILEPLGLSV